LDRRRPVGFLKKYCKTKGNRPWQIERGKMLFVFAIFFQKEAPSALRRLSITPIPVHLHISFLTLSVLSAV